MALGEVDLIQSSEGSTHTGMNEGSARLDND
jgi:hypothetical protein